MKLERARPENVLQKNECIIQTLYELMIAKGYLSTVIIDGIIVASINFLHQISALRSPVLNRDLGAKYADSQFNYDDFVAYLGCYQ